MYRRSQNVFTVMLKQFNKEKPSGQITSIWGSVRWKNAYGWRILKILYGVKWRENRNIYAIKTWNHTQLKLLLRGTPELMGFFFLWNILMTLRTALPVFLWWFLSNNVKPAYFLILLYQSGQPVVSEHP